MRTSLLLLALCGLLAGPARAETAPFDLAGPTLRVSVTHQGATLPIGEVPQLAAGDGLTVVADLPEDQSAHYLLIAAFLRGSTNPPPDKWFEQAETWTKKGRRGLSLTVPDGAEQVVLFLAPATGGDFATLRNAVKGRPGAFVRAAQELAQASLDHARLGTYLAAVRKAVPGDADRLARITPLLARSLQVKINADCLTKLPDLQAPCLLQNQESLVLDDGHSNAITDALDGPGADLALQLSGTRQAGFGLYSPYIAAIRDVISIFGSIRTAKYQYIPALAMLDGNRMALVLNAPPSFHNPKSVLVTALPIVAPVHVPPLRIVEPAPALCAQAPAPLLPVSGAPLVFATRYAHDLVLRASLPGGRTIDLPATSDAERGGLVVHVDGRLPADLPAPVDATLHGLWGFQPFDGPHVRLVTARPGQWHLAGATPDSLTVTAIGGVAACVAGVSVQSGEESPQPVVWKTGAGDTIAVTLPATLPKGAAATLVVAGPAGIAADRLALPRPAPPKGIAATLVARSVQRGSASPAPRMTLGSDAEIPADATFAFALRAESGVRLSGRDTVEIAADTGGASATLAAANGLRLADQHVVLATIRPVDALGPSAFGPLRARIVREGIAGDWLTLGTLVRLPRLQPLSCPADPAAACTLTGADIFLIDALSATPGFEHPVEVPDGFPGPSIDVPHPTDGTLYLRLRDDPTVVGRLAG